LPELALQTCRSLISVLALLMTTSSVVEQALQPLLDQVTLFRGAHRHLKSGVSTDVYYCTRVVVMAALKGVQIR